MWMSTAYFLFRCINFLSHSSFEGRLEHASVIDWTGCLGCSHTIWTPTLIFSQTATLNTHNFGHAQSLRSWYRMWYAHRAWIYDRVYMVSRSEMVRSSNITTLLFTVAPFDPRYTWTSKHCLQCMSIPVLSIRNHRLVNSPYCVHLAHPFLWTRHLDRLTSTTDLVPLLS